MEFRTTISLEGSLLPTAEATTSPCEWGRLSFTLDTVNLGPWMTKPRGVTQVYCCGGIKTSTWIYLWRSHISVLISPSAQEKGGSCRECLLALSFPVQKCVWQKKPQFELPADHWVVAFRLRLPVPCQGEQDHWWPVPHQPFLPCLFSSPQSMTISPIQELQGVDKQNFNAQ